jgi:hypothetical protein
VAEGSETPKIGGDTKFMTQKSNAEKQSRIELTHNRQQQIELTSNQGEQHASTRVVAAQLIRFGDATHAMNMKIAAPREAQVRIAEE